jgi:hypothetical protein
MKHTCALQINFMMLLAVLAISSQAVEVEVPAESNHPYLVPLRRESVPVRRHGKIASFKTSYSGVISVGSPKRQEFRVVFDTGSGHVVLPALECGSETCLLHQRYNMAASQSAQLVNIDGTVVAPGDYADQATIGFGTGEITGEFIKDRVCLGPADSSSVEHSGGNSDAPCLDVALIMAIEMSAQPFKSFAFDGILGLGLSSLALSPSFSFFDVLSKGNGAGSPHFAVYLTEAEEDGEESEVAIGGYNGKRLLEPLMWSPVAKKDLGYWQVHIVAVRINGQELDVCKDGTCHGVVDTGSSHLGVPAPHDREFAELLTQDAGDTLDCRLIDAPTIEIELPGANLTIFPETYMRRLPLREGVSVGSAKGVSMTPGEVNGKPAESDRMSVLSVNVTTSPAGSEKSGGALRGPQSSSANEPTSQVPGSEAPLPQQVRRHCRPKMMPVTMPAPLGPKLFILGEPVLHRYYTVYDWASPRIGFGLAASRRNVEGPLSSRPGADRRGSLPEGVDTILMQQRINVAVDSISARDADSGAVSHGWSDDSDDVMFAQLTISIVVRQV